MEQSPQNPGAPAQDSTMQASTVQGNPLPENTAQGNAVQENTVQNNAAESTTVEATAAPTVTALQSPEYDPALADTASVAPAEAVAPAPAEPKRMGLYSLICLLVAVPLGVSIGGIPLMWLYLTYTTGPNATLLIIASIIIWVCIAFAYCALVAWITEAIATRKLPWAQSLGKCARAMALDTIIITIIIFCLTASLMGSGY
ncbi:MAG: histidyl-tRNA synthetase [Rothia mucilaginosa]|uniref:histidyl-tRNA synthetase n=1 Tax=Rothia mucilaginosa TaxID=43675 RepID=UPI001DAB7CA6|nr:histidyl-tRNA synthetase [Rothia mucilaginosa]MBS6434168.1 histidyl-tRNA synthetase [Rothia mucilaginosa]